MACLRCKYGTARFGTYGRARANEESSKKLIMPVASGGGGEKLLQAKIIRSQIVFQFGDAIFHIRPAVVVAQKSSGGSAKLLTKTRKV